MVALRRALPAVAAATALGCEPPYEPLPPTEPVVVVHAVLNTRTASQYVVVESTQDERAFPEVFPGVPGLVPDAPGVNYPVSGAEVVIEHRTPPPGCASPAVRLTEQALPVEGDTITQTGIYTTTALCAFGPGDELALTVRALGHVVTGTTIVPGVGAVSVGLRPGDNGPDTVVVQRERDSIWIVTPGLTGAAAQYEVTRPDPLNHDDPLPFDLSYSYITDTAGAVSIAGDLVMPFELDGADLFNPGRYYLLTVAAADRNYFDFARSASDLFTGRGFVNHLEDGIGVFGSVDPAVRVLKIVAERRTPEEGRYRITGTVEAGPVDAILEVYRTQALGGYIDTAGVRTPDQPFSAFVSGTWGGQPLTLGVAHGEFDRTLSGTVFPTDPGALWVEVVAVTGSDTARYHLEGTRAGVSVGEQFKLVTYGRLPVDTLTAVQVTSGR